MKAQSKNYRVEQIEGKSFFLYQPYWKKYLSYDDNWNFKIVESKAQARKWKLNKNKLKAQNYNQLETFGKTGSRVLNCCGVTKNKDASLSEVINNPKVKIELIAQSFQGETSYFINMTNDNLLLAMWSDDTMGGTNKQGAYNYWNLEK